MPLLTRRFSNRARVRILAGLVLSAVTFGAVTGTSSAASSSIRYEVESLPTPHSSGDLFSKSTAHCAGTCVIYRSNKVGDYVSYNVQAPHAGPYVIKIAVKKIATRGSFQLAIKGAPSQDYAGTMNNLGKPVDLYAPKAEFEEVTIGRVSFGSAGTKEFQFKVTGKDKASKGYTLGLDSIILVPQSKATTTTTAKPTTTTAKPTTTTAKPTTTTAKPPASPAPSNSSVLSADFDSVPLGPVTPKEFNDEVGYVTNWAPNFDDMSVVSDGRGGRAMRTTLDANTYRSTPGNNGEVLPVKLSGEFDQACMSYDVRFSSDFEWSLGGKLPGLLGVAPGVSPSEPAGGGPTDRGWSGRLMWRGANATRWPGQENMVVTYLYHPGQAGVWGDDVRWDKALVAGNWHTVKQCHTMNTVGKADGVLQAWMDGKLVVDQSNVNYRTRADVHINYFEWDIFRGGNTQDWASSRTGYVDMDNVKVTAK